MPAEGEAPYLERARRDLLTGSAWTVLAAAIGLPVAVVANVVLARTLGSVGLGHYAEYTAIFAIVQIATNLGFSEATVQWLAEATAKGEAPQRIELIRRCAGFHLLLAGPALAVAALLLLGDVASLRDWCAVAAVLITQGAGTSLVVNTASTRNTVSAKIALGTNTLIQAGLVATAAATHSPRDTFVVFLVLGVTPGTIGFFSLERAERRALLSPTLAWHFPRGFRTYAASACAGGLVALLVFGRSEVIILRADGFLVAAGVFTVITGLATQMTGLLDSALAPLTPIAAGLVALDRDRARRVFGRALKLSGAFGAFVATSFIPIGILGIDLLYGHAFRGSGAPFGALALVSCLQTVLGPLTAFAFATRSAAQVLRVNLLCLVVDAALAIGLIPWLGLWGAVGANAASQVLSLVRLIAVVSRRLDYPVAPMLRHVRLFALGVALAVGQIAVCAQFHGPRLITIPLFALLGVLLLRAALYLWPDLGLEAEELAQFDRLGQSRKLRVLLGVMRLIGMVPAEDLTVAVARDGHNA